MQRDSLCDLLVHVNALLPCLVVWCRGGARNVPAPKGARHRYGGAARAPSLRRRRGPRAGHPRAAAPPKSAPSVAETVRRYTLGVLRSVFAAVVLYEAVLVVGPIVTLRLRTPPAAKATRDGVVRLARALVRPSEWRRCGQTSTGVLCVCGFGCFFIYLICFQRPLEHARPSGNLVRWS